MVVMVVSAVVVNMVVMVVMVVRRGQDWTGLDRKGQKGLRQFVLEKRNHYPHQSLIATRLPLV